LALGARPRPALQLPRCAPRSRHAPCAAGAPRPRALGGRGYRARRGAARRAPCRPRGARGRTPPPPPPPPPPPRAPALAGRSRILSVGGEPRFDAAGIFVGYLGVARDVTEEVRAQRAMAASE